MVVLKRVESEVIQAHKESDAVLIKQEPEKAPDFYEISKQTSRFQS